MLDFGSQTSHLILRRLRSLKVYAEMLPCTTKLADLTWKPKGVVLSGGPSSVYDEGSPREFAPRSGPIARANVQKTSTLRFSTSAFPFCESRRSRTSM